MCGPKTTQHPLNFCGIARKTLYCSCCKKMSNERKLIASKCQGTDLIVQPEPPWPPMRTPTAPPSLCESWDAGLSTAVDETMGRRQGHSRGQSHDMSDSIEAEAAAVTAHGGGGRCLDGGSGGLLGGCKEEGQKRGTRERRGLERNPAPLEKRPRVSPLVKRIRKVRGNGAR